MLLLDRNGEKTDVWTRIETACLKSAATMC